MVSAGRLFLILSSEKRIETVVTVVDYGMGNVASVVNAFQYLGATVRLTSDPKEITESSILILPGVGSYKKGMEALVNRGIDKAILDAVSYGDAKILGICLGMHLMGSYGTEDGKFGPRAT